MPYVAPQPDEARAILHATSDNEEEEWLYEPTPSATASSGPRRHLLAFVSVVSVVVAVAGFAMLSQKGGSWILGKASTNDVQKLYEAQQGCYAYTGGSCMTSACDPSRKASCQSKSCVCMAGCSGPNGTCFSGQTNLVVAAAITLKSKAWPSYAMYVQASSTFGQLKTTNAYEWMNFGQDKFSIWKLPGTLGGEAKYFLGSNKWPDSVARVAMTTGTSFSTHGLYNSKLSDDYGPDAIALTICLRPTGDIMLGSASATPRWAYIHSGSWLVYATTGDPGSGGYWTPTPAIPQSALPACPS
jgi:hypothetical protein